MATVQDTAWSVIAVSDALTTFSGHGVAAARFRRHGGVFGTLRAPATG
jgi:hypothetical protein